MNRNLLLILIISGLVLQQCRVIREVQQHQLPELKGMEGMVQRCAAIDTIQSFLISKAEAILVFEDERYEVEVTIYSRKDSVIYISAVSSGYEIIRGSVDKDSIKVINRLNKILYKAPLKRRFGYQYPVNFGDLQNVLTSFYLCDNIELAQDDQQNHLLFEFDEDRIKKRILLDRNTMLLDKFEFYHQQTEKYLMGERIEKGFKIYSNFMITAFEITAEGGEISYNQDMKVKMDVNPRKYTFTELR